MYIEKKKSKARNFLHNEKHSLRDISDHDSSFSTHIPAMPFQNMTLSY